MSWFSPSPEPDSFSFDDLLSFDDVFSFDELFPFGPELLD